MLCVSILCSALFAEPTDAYRIQHVNYNIKGSTLEYPLTQAVPVDKTTVFQNQASFSLYVEDLKVQLKNQRIFESSSIDIEYGTVGSDGIIPVSLTIHTSDTWNIIALPYPKYDSNTGLEFKLKIKDYNFFGSMQELNGDLIYKVDENQKTAFNANLSFNIPFKAWEYSSNWNNDLSVSFPTGEKPQLDGSTGFNIAFPLGSTAVTVGLTQKLAVNDRNDLGPYADDPVYFNEKLYTSLPVVLARLPYFGNLAWTPTTSVTTNWSFTGIHHEDLKGIVVSWGHGFSLGRFDWLGNFRSGLIASLDNSYSYNISKPNNVAITVGGEVTVFHTFLDLVGINSRLNGFYNFYGAENLKVAENIRGILTKRVTTDTAFTLNIDLPIRIMRVNFEEITGVHWTRLIGFEMHASPFFDMALTHDPVTGRYYSFKDGWYSGGMEILIFPMKMRSIYGRISAGYDLVELARNGGKLSGDARRDGEPINEYLLGIGLFY